MSSISVDLLGWGSVSSWDEWIVVGVSIESRDELLHLVTDEEKSLIEPGGDLFVVGIEIGFVGIGTVVKHGLEGGALNSESCSLVVLGSLKSVPFIGTLVNKVGSGVGKTSVQEDSGVTKGGKELGSLLLGLGGEEDSLVGLGLFVDLEKSGHEFLDVLASQSLDLGVHGGELVGDNTVKGGELFSLKLIELSTILSGTLVEGVSLGGSGSGVGILLGLDGSLEECVASLNESSEFGGLGIKSGLVSINEFVDSLSALAVEEVWALWCGLDLGVQASADGSGASSVGWSTVWVASLLVSVADDGLDLVDGVPSGGSDSSGGCLLLTSDICLDGGEGLVERSEGSFNGVGEDGDAGGSSVSGGLLEVSSEISDGSDELLTEVVGGIEAFLSVIIGLIEKFVESVGDLVVKAVIASVAWVGD